MWRPFPLSFSAILRAGAEGAAFSTDASTRIFKLRRLYSTETGEHSILGVDFFFAARVQRNPKKRTEKKIPTEYFKIHECCSWIPEIQKIQTLRLMQGETSD